MKLFEWTRTLFRAARVEPQDVTPVPTWTPPYRVACDRHDECRPVFTAGRPLDDRCPWCVIESLEAAAAGNADQFRQAGRTIASLARQLGGEVDPAHPNGPLCLCKRIRARGLEARCPVHWDKVPEVHRFHPARPGAPYWKTGQCAKVLESGYLCGKLELDGAHQVEAGS